MVRAVMVRPELVRPKLVRAELVRTELVRAVVVRHLVVGPVVVGVRGMRARSTIRIVTGGLAIAGAVVLLALRDRPSVVDVHPLSPVVLIVLFAIAELCVVHVFVNHEARTFSLSEIPLLIGLAYLSPVALILCRITGSFVALGVVRRQAVRKLSFNLSYFLLDTGVAVLVYRAVLHGATPYEARGWAAGFAATAASLVLGAFAVSVVIGAANGSGMRSPLESIAGIGTVTTVLSTTMGLVAVGALAPRAVSPWMLAAGAGAAFAAYASHSRLRQSAEHLEQFSHFSREIARALTRGAVDLALLEQSCELLRVERAELVLDGDEPPALLVLDRGVVTVLHGPDAKDAAIAHRQQLNGQQAARNGDSMVVTLTAGHERLGTLLVAGRIGEADHFTADDMQLFEMLAAHGSVCLVNHRLIELLRD